MAKHGRRVDRAVHNYLYFVFYYPYVWSAYHLFRLLFRYFTWFRPLRHILRMAFDRYHGKIISLDDTRTILTIDEDIDIDAEENKRIIPFAYARRILFEEADFIAVMDCPCKLTLHAPDGTINSCLCVGRKTAEFWLDRCGEKYHARKISPEEALDLVRTFRQNGHVTQAFFKVATGGSTGVLCNCRVDTCVSLQATLFARRFDPHLTMNADAGYSCRHDDALCRRCGTCEGICQFGAIRVTGGNWQYDRAACLGCGLCPEHCPEHALSLYRDERKTVPLDLHLLRRERDEDAAADWRQEERERRPEEGFRR